MTVILALAACHNRRATTLRCLASLERQQLPVGVSLSIVLVDDGSNDGTAPAVSAAHPTVRLIPGSGDLFWAGGMRFGWERVKHERFDYVLVFNDDVEFKQTAIADLLACHEATAAASGGIVVIAGGCRSPATNAVTYGGLVRKSRWHPLRFRWVAPAGIPQRVDTLNMNCAIIPRIVLERMGFLADYFTHTGADFEYGLRVSRAGGAVWLAPRFVGWCEPGVSRPASVIGRVNEIFSRRGHPVSQHAGLYRAYGGPLWPLLLVAAYAVAIVRAFIPLAPRQGLGPPSVTHAARDAEDPASVAAPPRANLSVVVPIGPGRDGSRAIHSLATAGLQSEDEVLLVYDGHKTARCPQLPCVVRTSSWPQPRGAPAARNHGMAMATNEVICFLDDDDSYVPGALDRIRAEVVKAEPAVAWCLGWRSLSGASQRLLRRGRWIRQHDLDRRNVAGGGSTMVVRRREFQALGGFDETLVSMEDWDAWLRLAARGPIRRLAEPLIEYDDVGTRRLSSTAPKRVEGLQQVLAKHAAVFPPDVRRFHQARLAVERLVAGRGSWRELPLLSAPLATLLILGRVFYGRMLGQATGATLSLRSVDG